MSTEDADPAGETTGGQSIEGGASTDEQVGVGDFEGEVVTCGPVEIAVEAIEAAEGRVQDSTVLAFSAVGLPLVAEELWSEVPRSGVVSGDPGALVVVDPDPIDESTTYWVRVAQPSIGSSFDGLCSVDPPTTSGRAAQPPAECSVLADGISVTVLWSGADPAAAIVVSRDGVDLHTVAASERSSDLQLLYDERRELHTEPALPPPSQADPGSGGYSDLGAEPGVVHQYAVQAVADGGIRSEAVSCGEATLDASDLDLSCGVASDALGFPVVTWEGAGTAQVVVYRDGIPLEPQAVTFISPLVDREAPVGVSSGYSVAVAGNEQVPCGSVVRSASTGGPAEVQQAATENVIDHKGPFEYVTLEPICAGCDGTVVEIYLVPDLDNDRNRHKVQTVWVDGVETTSATGIWLIDPLFIGPALLEADAAGSEIDFSIDPDTGLIYRWTIDGEGAEMTCFEIDTRPIEMRERCGAQNKLG